MKLLNEVELEQEIGDRRGGLRERARERGNSLEKCPATGQRLARRLGSSRSQSGTFYLQNDSIAVSV